MLDQAGATTRAPSLTVMALPSAKSAGVPPAAMPCTTGGLPGPSQTVVAPSPTFLTWTAMLPAAGVWA